MPDDIEKNPFMRKLHLDTFLPKPTEKPKKAPQRPQKTHPSLLKLRSKLGSLISTNAIEFSRELNFTWQELPVDDRHYIQKVRSSLSYLEANADEVTFEALKHCVALSMSPEAFIIFSDSLSEIFSNSLGDVELYNRTATEVGFENFVDDALLWEFRRRLDRRIDAHRHKFVDSLETPSQRARKERDKGGRPPESNWDEMEAYVLEQFPDGIPTMVGTKAKIAGFFGIWLEKEGRTPPDERHLLRKAAELYNKYHNLK